MYQVGTKRWAMALFGLMAAQACMGCRQDSYQTGAARVTYRNSSSAGSAVREIELALYDRRYSNFNCGYFSSGYGGFNNYNGYNNVALNGSSNYRRTISSSGAEVFETLEVGQWFVLGTGFGNNQVPVTQGCQEFTVEANQVREVSLTLSDRALDIGRLYRTTFDIGGALPGLVQVLLRSLPLFCSAATNLDPLVCNLIRSVSSLVGDIDVDATWQIEQSGTTASISLLVDRLNGRVMDGQCRRMARGRVSGYVSGSEIKETADEPLRIDTDEFITCLQRSGLLNLDTSTYTGAIFDTALSLLSGGVEIFIDDLEITSAVGGKVDSLRGEVTIKLDLAPFGSYETSDDIVADRYQ